MGTFSICTICGFGESEGAAPPLHPINNADMAKTWFARPTALSANSQKENCFGAARWFTVAFAEGSLRMRKLHLKAGILKEERRRAGLTMGLLLSLRFVWLLSLFALGACGGPPFVVPPELQEQLDREATFAKMFESPNAYKGHVVMLTGMVLNIEILPKFTRVEFLQLPLDEDGAPVSDLYASQGRFLVNCHHEVINPLQIPPGTRMSVIGEMQGTSRIEGSNYPYITLESKAIHVYPQEDQQRLKDPTVLWSICPTAPKGFP